MLEGFKASTSGRGYNMFSLARCPRVVFVAPVLVRPSRFRSLVALCTRWLAALLSTACGCGSAITELGSSVGWAGLAPCYYVVPTTAVSSEVTGPCGGISIILPFLSPVWLAARDGCRVGLGSWPQSRARPGGWGGGPVSVLCIFPTGGCLLPSWLDRASPVSGLGLLCLCGALPVWSPPVSSFQTVYGNG